jgi:hypothetical protein
MLTKGNIVKFDRGDNHGIVLNVRKDGTRANVYRYGRDSAEWVPVNWLTVVTTGTEKCYKCGGSGLYYFGGMVLNGVYQGKTGPCFGCEGKGEQTDADRLRCHFYWHRKVEDGVEIETPLDASPAPEIAPEPKPAMAMAANRKRREYVADDSKLIDCKGCGALHRDDVLCPW